MNIGIDIDGTLNKYPEFFCELSRLFRQAGHRVYLITGLGVSSIEAKMRGVTGFACDGVYATDRYNADERALIGVEPENERIVGRFKQRICQELGVAIMFDDMASIHREFGPVPIFEVP